jgi:hypothetical protein
MSALSDFYAGQSSHEWYRAEQQSLHQEAEQRGLSVGEVAAERYAAVAEQRRAEAERVAAIVNDPALLRRLKAYWERHLTGESWLQDPLAPPPAPRKPAPRTGPPVVSAGRTVNIGRPRARGGGSDVENDLAAVLFRARGRV